jgi:hypothetical protein
MDQALARNPGSHIAVFDNSCGAGALLQFADPLHHRLYAADVHAPSVEALADVADSAGFKGEILTASMESLRPSGMGLTLINPPFSINLNSATLMDLPCVGIGHFGPGSSAVSHAYALEQALAASDVVLAILPTSYAQARYRDDRTHPRLRALIQLPKNTFQEEATKVEVSVLVYGQPANLPAQALIVSQLDDPLPDFGLHLRAMAEHPDKPSLGRIEDALPSITGPVTGDNHCRVVHSGRKIHLLMRCAFTKARVLNAVYRSPVSNGDPRHRYPGAVRFSGQGVLDVEVHCAQSDPIASLERLLACIRDAGADPIVDPGLINHLRKRHRLRSRQNVALRFTGQMADRAATASTGDSLRVRAIRSHQLNPKRWGSALIKAGEEFAVAFDGACYVLTHPSTGEQQAMEEHQLRADFELIEPAHATGWTLLQAGRSAAYPHIAAAVRGRLRQCGVLNVTNWGFQLDDIVEASIAPGGVVAWEMGCGKTRALISLAMMGGRRNAIVVEAHLVDEILAQLREIGMPPADYQVITRADQCSTTRLKRLNIITYNRLRMPVCDGAGRRTFARALRRRFSRVLCDEAHLLRNYDTEQTRAVWMLSPRSRIAATGTPVANYARDLLGLAQWSMGDGTASQPFGRFHPYLETNHALTMDHSQRGADVFKDRHCSFEWVTHEFEHSGLRTGAKREVPKIRNLAALREWTGRLLLRRTTSEPEVAQHFHSPSYEVIEHEVAWDEAHLSYFLRVADGFAQWYRKARQESEHSAKQINLVALLARIGAVLRAGTYPQHGNDAFGAYAAMTSKQRAVLKHTQALVGQGHKIVLYVEQPGNAELFVRELAARGIAAFAFHGQRPIAQRTADLNTLFRQGAVPVMVATLGVSQTGLNLHCADRAVFACHDWSWKTISQAMGRLLRPQQTQHVVFDFFSLPGSLDDYQRQMVAMKRDTTGAVVDGLSPEMEDVDFIHLDQVIDTFVEDLAKSRGLQHGYELRERLKERAA